MNCSEGCCENEKNDESKNWQTTVTCLDYEQKKCARFSWHLSKSISPVILWCSCWRIKFTPLPYATWEKTSCQVKQSIQLLYKCLIYDKYPLEAHRGAKIYSTIFQTLSLSVLETSWQKCKGHGNVSSVNYSLFVLILQIQIKI